MVVWSLQSQMMMRRVDGGAAFDCGVDRDHWAWAEFFVDEPEIDCVAGGLLLLPLLLLLLQVAAYGGGSADAGTSGRVLGRAA